MSKIRNLLFVAAACAALSACKKEADVPADPQQAGQPVVEELPPGQSPAPPVEPPADAVIPVTVSADAVKVGSSQNPDQSAASPKQSYGTADTVYASARTGGYPVGAKAYVYWTYEDGLTHKEEEKAVSGDVVSFRFSQADGMKPGKYNVEIDINDKPVGIVDFVVR